MSSARYTLLFVDDETKVLNGLRRVLSSKRVEWHLLFASSAKEALNILAEADVDIVLSDMRMPGMDGIQLLSKVKAYFPDIMRVILSGTSDREAIFSSVGLTHQFLTKPCEPNFLISTISNLLTVRETLKDDALKELVSKIDSLPSPPRLYQQLMAELSQGDISLARVGELVAKDSAMSAKILQLVNSSFFGLATHISSPELATSLLGLDTIKALVLQIHIFSTSKNVVDNFTLDNLWRHCLLTAEFSKIIAKCEGLDKNKIESAYISGLLHDVGKIIMMSKLPTEFSKAESLSFKKQVPLFRTEGEVFGTTHATVGAYLLGLWGLPAEVVKITASHHTPDISKESAIGPLTAVHVADSLAHASELGVIFPMIDKEYLAALGASDRMATWESACTAIQIEEIIKE